MKTAPFFCLFIRWIRCNAHCTRKSNQMERFFSVVVGFIFYFQFICVVWRTNLSYHINRITYASDFSFLPPGHIARTLEQPKLNFFGTNGKSKPKPTIFFSSCSPIKILILFRFCSVVAAKNNRTDKVIFQCSCERRIGDLWNTVFGWQKTIRFLFRLIEKFGSVNRSDLRCDWKLSQTPINCTAIRYTKNVNFFIK